MDNTKSIKNLFTTFTWNKKTVWVYWNQKEMFTVSTCSDGVKDARIGTFYIPIDTDDLNRIISDSKSFRFDLHIKIINRIKHLVHIENLLINKKIKLNNFQSFKIRDNKCFFILNGFTAKIQP